MNVFKKTVRIFSYVILSLGFAGLIVCCCHSDMLEINKYNYKNSKLNGTSFKAAIISDYHHRELKFSNTNMIDAIKGLKQMDAVFITGDLIDTHVKNLNDVNEIFEATREITNNIYFVTGNHEEYAPLWPELRDSFTKNNVKFLDNKMDNVTFKNQNVVIYGLMDPRFDTHGYKNGKIEEGKSKEYLDAFKIDKDNNINILLTHRPELIDLYAKYEFDYVFCGHSHGGQIKIGNWTPLNLAFKGKTYPRGEFKVNNTTMVVSAGLGHSAMFPLRINCNPEIVTITITK